GPGQIVVVEEGGKAVVIERYEKERRQIGRLRVADAADFTAIQEFTPWYLATFEKGAVVRISCTLSEIGEVMKAVHTPIVARAGTGICYAYFNSAEGAAAVALAR